MTPAPTAPVLVVGARPTGTLVCVRCRLRVRFGEADGDVVADLLASHWFDDHGLAHWRDRAAEGRDRLWRTRPELLERPRGVGREGPAPTDGVSGSVSVASPGYCVYARASSLSSNPAMSTIRPSRTRIT